MLNNIRMSKVPQPTRDIAPYLKGEKLWGDDFSSAEIAEWIKDEKEAYAELSAKNRENYQYQYHALSYLTGFRFLPNIPIANALGIGSAYGEEFTPIIHRIDKLSIVEPSDVFKRSEISGKSVRYYKPDVSGALPFDEGFFDLITCFGVLHHIPNVSYVVRELFRCLRPGGYALFREPIVSMGNWNSPRKGATKRERGIPLPVFRRIITDAGFSIFREKPYLFSATSKLQTVFPACNSKAALLVDDIFCRLFQWNYSYHADTVLGKLRPTCVSYVLTKSSRT